MKIGLNVLLLLLVSLAESSSAFLLPGLFRTLSPISCFSKRGGIRMSSASTKAIIVHDSHLHVWSNGKAPFPYAAGSEPPEDLRFSPTQSLEECGASEEVNQLLTHGDRLSFCTGKRRLWRSC